jgi:hypothetical protein
MGGTMKISEIAKGNDVFRNTLIKSPRHKIVFSAMIESDVLQELITAVRTFSKFNQANDPHGEHDFGKVVVHGETYFWKIDYYDANWEYGVNPHEEFPHRLLTIMPASEY